MIGTAAESVILELRDALVSRLNSLSLPAPKKLLDWKIKPVLDELFVFLDSRKTTFPRKLQEDFQGYWNAFAQQIRTTRNDAGHPTSIDPVTEDSVHASFWSMSWGQVHVMHVMGSHACHGVMHVMGSLHVMGSGLACHGVIACHVHVMCACHGVCMSWGHCMSWGQVLSFAFE